MRSLFALAALVALTVACSGGTTPTSPSLPSLPPGISDITLLTRGTVSATVDGVQWDAALPSAGVGSNTLPGVAPLVAITGVSASRLGISLSGPLAVGTHPLGGNSFVNFSLVQDFATSWSATPFTTGSSGVLTITIATPTRIAGTFSFAAVARTAGTVPATRTVTNGTFDVFQ